MSLKRHMQANTHLLFAGFYILFALLLPVVLKPLLGSAYTQGLNIAVLAAAWAIGALGLNMIVGYCGLLNLGFAGFMLIGAYTSGILMKEYNWPFPAAMVASVAHGALWGIILGIPTLRLTGDYFAIVTFGFSELVIMMARNWDAITRGSKGYPNVPRPVLDLTWIPGSNYQYAFTLTNRVPYWYLAAFLLGICMIISYRLLRSRLGRAWLALREDEVAAEACGINSMWYKTIAFAVSAGFGALGGAFLTCYFAMVDYRNYEFMTSVFVLCYVVLGGMGTVVGPVIGAATLVTMVELLRDNPARLLSGLFQWWPAASETLAALPWKPDLRLVIYGIILILVIRFRPEGLVPSRSRATELHEHGLEGEPHPDSLYELRRR